MTTPRPLSSAAIRAINAPETSENFLWLLRITHPSLIPSIRLVRGYQNVKSRGNNYVAFPFAPQVAQDEPDRPPTLSIVIGNVSRAVTAQLDGVVGTPKVRLEIVLTRQPWRVEWVLEDLEMRGHGYDKIRLRAELTAEDYFTAPLPDLRFTQSIAPGAHRI